MRVKLMTTVINKMKYDFVDNREECTLDASKSKRWEEIFRKILTHPYKKKNILKSFK